MSPQTRLRWFRRLALAGAILAAVVVVLGAWVRLTDAGLGCPDWPGCYGHTYPQAAHDVGKAWHEMVHRYFAATLVLVISMLLVWAVAFRKDPGQPRTPVLLLFVIVLFQAALGAFTVTRLLKPLIVTGHLLGGLTTLGILCWLALTPAEGRSTARERRLLPFALFAFALLVLQIALGGWTSSNYAAVACPDFPTCQQAWWPPMDFRNAFVLWHGLDIDYTGGVLANPARVAIHVTHRFGAAIAGTALLLVGVAVLFTGSSGRLRLAGFLVAAAVLLQICIGISMVRFGLPLPLATMHNAGAALLVICVVALLRMLVPLPHVHRSR
jgi:cytochrome c oxidase assembly protein subunit 15